MTADFYTDNEKKAATVENFLFSGQYTQLMNGETLIISGDQYHINSMHWLDDTKKVLNVFVWKYPKK
jgi:hypothetical protein